MLIICEDPWDTCPNINQRKVRHSPILFDLAKKRVKKKKINITESRFSCNNPHPRVTSSWVQYHTKIFSSCKRKDNMNIHSHDYRNLFCILT